MVQHSFQWNYAGSDVKVTGEFDNWSATTSMQRTEAGHFVKVVDLPSYSKVYYKFVVDGHWCVDGQALKEGEGAHENNYILTGAADEGVSASDTTFASTAQLPVLGHAASYVTPQPSETRSTATTAASTTTTHETSATSSASVAVAPTTSPATNSGVDSNVVHYDDKGPSPSDPQAVRNARDNTLADAYTNAINYLPSRDEVEREAQHVAEVAGGLLAASLAAGAAVFGLSTHNSHTETSPITGKTVATPVSPTAQTTEPIGTTLSKASESVSREAAQASEVVTSKVSDASQYASTKAAEVIEALPASSAQPSSLTETETDKSGEPIAAKETQVSQTGSLEQAAVAAATSAATNAYTASGLSGLSGVGAPVSSISKNGSIGFTGIGTAINEKTGVVGTSKIVQGVDDAHATEDTQTAKLAGASAGTLLQNHENGAKVERISEHAVLAEVGVGGAAIGTAVVTDRTVSNAAEIAIPAQAAEHLDAQSSASAAHTGTAVSETAMSETTTTEASRPAFVSVESGLAPALQHDEVRATAVAVPAAVTTPVSIAQATSAVESVPVIASPTIPSTKAVETDQTVSSSARRSSVIQEPSSATKTTETMPKADAIVPVPTTSAGSTSLAPRASKAAAVSAVLPSSGASAVPSGNKVSAAPVSASATSTSQASPSKAAALAASKSSTLRQSARPEKASESTTATSDSQEKKKKSILKRMKSMFNSKSK